MVIRWHIVHKHTHIYIRRALAVEKIQYFFSFLLKIAGNYSTRDVNSESRKKICMNAIYLPFLCEYLLVQSIYFLGVLPLVRERKAHNMAAIFFILLIQ